MCGDSRHVGEVGSGEHAVGKLFFPEQIKFYKSIVI